MTNNQEIARLLADLGTLLEIDGEARSRNRILQKAADTVRGLETDLDDNVLQDLNSKTLGDEPREVIKEYLASGSSTLLDKLLKKYSSGLIDIVSIPGIGASRARSLYDDFNISSLDALVAFGENGLTQVKGIGAKSAQKMIIAASQILDERDELDDASQDEHEDIHESATVVIAPDDNILSIVELEGQETVVLETNTSEPAVKEKPKPEQLSIEDKAQKIRATLHELSETDTSDTPAPETSQERLKADAWYWSNLRCAACHRVGLELQQGSVECNNCGRRYLIEDGIVDMIGSRGSRTFAQQLMEFKPYSVIYERLARPMLTRLVTDRRLEEEYVLHADLLALKPGLRVLDIASGPGNFTRYFAEIIEGDDASLVIGTDMSWPMLTQARQSQIRSGLDDLRYVRGDATRLPFADTCFDRVHCAGALHLFEDIDRALREIARVTTPGGLVVIGTFLAGHGLLKRTPRKALGKAAGFHWFDQDELRRRIQDAGLDVTDEDVNGSAISVQAKRV